MVIYFKTVLGMTMCGVLMQPILATAQNNANDTGEVIQLVNQLKNEKALNFSFGLPDSPVLSLAGLKAGDVTKVDELQNFVVSAPQFLNGELTLAADINPANILQPIEDYQDTLQYYEDSGRMYRMLRRTRLSVLGKVGKENVVDPSKSTKSLFATGLSSSVLDASDPLYVATIDKVEECKTFIFGVRTMIGDASVTGLLDSVKPLDQTLDASSGKLDLDPINQINIDQIKSDIEQVRATLTRLGKPPNKVMATTVDLNDIQKTRVALKKEVEDLSAFTVANFSEEQKLPAGLLESKRTCYDAVNEARFYIPNLDVGAALLWRGKDHEFGSLQPGGQALWVSYRHPIRLHPGTKGPSKHYFAIGATGRAGFGEMATTGNTTTPEAKANTLQAWGGAELFTNEWRIAGRYGYVDADFRDPAHSLFSRDGDRWLISADYKLPAQNLVGGDVWLGLSYGKAQGTIDALDGERLTVDLRFSEPKAINLFNLGK